MTQDERVWASFEDCHFMSQTNPYTLENLLAFYAEVIGCSNGRAHILTDEEITIAEIIKRKIAQLFPDYAIRQPEGSRIKPLCIVLNRHQRTLLDKAEAEGLIGYVAERKGYAPVRARDHRLVAYLCGCIFCHDYTDADGLWVSGGNLECEADIDQLMGFKVGMTRRSARSNGKGKSPAGYKRVDRVVGNDYWLGRRGETKMRRRTKYGSSFFLWGGCDVGVMECERA